MLNFIEFIQYLCGLREGTLMAKKTTKKTTRKKSGGRGNAKLKSTQVSALEEVQNLPKKELTQYQKVKEKLLRKTTLGNAEKRKIAIDMLERYTGHRIDQFQTQIILTNFHYYIERFNQILPDAEHTKGSAFEASSSKDCKVTIIEFGIGSAMAALIMELCTVIQPKAVLFLGMCGAVHSSLKVGDFILPIAAIRAEGVSTHFMPPQVPALPTFKVQKFVSEVLVENGLDYRTGAIHSTDLRFWEFDEKFKENLIREKVLAVEMETAALYVTALVNKVSIGSLLLVSDCPFKRGGIKTKKSAKSVFSKFTDRHIELGIEIMTDIQKHGEKIRHYRW